MINEESSTENTWPWPDPSGKIESGLNFVLADPTWT